MDRIGHRARRVRAVAAVLVLGLTWTPGPAQATVPNPTVTGPIGGAGIRGHALWDGWFELGDIGYTEDEYFVSGVARQLGGSSQTAEYTTRIIVTRPAEPADFNGSVLLDWVNVTAQFENAVDTISAHEMLFREGWAFVHVSAQAAGICCTPLTPKVWDPVRYEALSHPGDAYALDIFSQVAQAIASPQGVDPMGGLEAEVLIAAGQSQSAGRLDAYVRTAQADAGIIDAFLIHGGGGKTFPDPPAAPVLHLLSDAEANATAPNQTDNYVLWEIAGSSHSDFYIGYHQVVGQGPRFAGAPKQPASAHDDLDVVAGNYGEVPHPMHATCILAGSAFPTRYAVNAALVHLDAWVRDGTTPPSGPRFTFSGGMLARDADGNALGGIRLPPVEVPVATYVSTVCALGGKTVPFTEAQLLLRYPTHEVYYQQTAVATQQAVDGGFLLPADAADFLARACAAKIRWQDLGEESCA
jgi:hypothetical protein